MCIGFWGIKPDRIYEGGGARGRYFSPVFPNRDWKGGGARGMRQRGGNPTRHWSERERERKGGRRGEGKKDDALE